MQFSPLKHKIIDSFTHLFIYVKVNFLQRKFYEILKIEMSFKAQKISEKRLCYYCKHTSIDPGLKIQP